MIHLDNMNKHLNRRGKPNTARFVTSSCYKKLPLFSKPKNCEIFLEELDEWRDKEHIEIWAYVIMPNHIHLLLFAEYPIDLRKQLGKLKGRTALKMIKYLKQTNSSILNQIFAIDHGKEIHRSGKKVVVMIGRYGLVKKSIKPLSISIIILREMEWLKV